MCLKKKIGIWKPGKRIYRVNEIKEWVNLETQQIKIVTRSRESRDLKNVHVWETDKLKKKDYNAHWYKERKKKIKRL